MLIQLFFNFVCVIFRDWSVESFLLHGFECWSLNVARRRLVERIYTKMLVLLTISHDKIIQPTLYCLLHPISAVFQCCFALTGCVARPHDEAAWKLILWPSEKHKSYLRFLKAIFGKK